MKRFSFSIFFFRCVNSFGIFFGTGAERKFKKKNHFLFQYKFHYEELTLAGDIKKNKDT